MSIYAPPAAPILELYRKHRRAILTLSRFTGLSSLSILWGLSI